MGSWRNTPLSQELFETEAAVSKCRNTDDGNDGSLSCYDTSAWREIGEVDDTTAAER